MPADTEKMESPFFGFGGVISPNLSFKQEDFHSFQNLPKEPELSSNPSASGKPRAKRLWQLMEMDLQLDSRLGQALVLLPDMPERASKHPLA